MAFISILILDLSLMGLGLAAICMLLGLFGFGVFLIIAAIVAKIVRHSRLQKGKPTFSKTRLLSNIAIVLGIICIAPLTVVLIELLLI